MILAVVVAIAIPLAFLYLVRWLDLYASGSFQVVLLCLGWGMVAFFCALQVNTYILGYVGYGLLVTLVAPMVEEFLKSMAVVYLVRRPQFTYFVDGAIYGFAAGTAFAVLENLLYLSRAGDGSGTVVTLSRAFSTSLMHGSASALVGIALGKMRFGRGIHRPLSLLVGWAGAIALHVTFNNVINNVEGILVLALAVGIGLAGVALTVAFILWGLGEERNWLKETLGIDAGVSSGESAVVQQMADLDTLLAPIGERFGVEKRKQVESFLQMQAQLGLKRKVQGMTHDEKLRGQLGKQIATLREDMDLLRRDVGVYCMSYVRSILPPETEPMWARLGQSLETQKSSGGRSLWSSLGDRMEAAEEGD